MVTSRQMKRLLNIKLMKMSEIKIELPEGYELKQERAVYKVVKKEVKYAEDLNDIYRPYYIDIGGGVGSSEYQTIEHLPTRGLTEGVLALIQLLSFRQDIWDKGGKPEGAPAYGIRCTNSSFVVSRQGPHGLLYFKTKEHAEYFLDKHKELIIEYLNNLK